MPNRGNDLDSWISLQALISKLYAHDFKNPISALSANLSYIEAVLPAGDDDLKEAVGDSMQALRQLLYMINNFLQVSRIEAGDRLEPGAIGVSQLVSASVARCKELVVSSGVDVEAVGDIPDGCLEMELPYADLALDNLILVSAQHSYSGGKVEVRVRETERFFEFEVSDSGKPVAVDQREVLFTREHQSKAKSISDSRYGRAMGLYAVGVAASFLGGEAEAPRDAETSVFVLRLPKAEE